MNVHRADELLRAGASNQTLTRQVRTGELVRVRHGAYANSASASVLEAHRRLIAGTWPLLDEYAVLSDFSAGVLHGLPSWEQRLGPVTIIRASSGHGSRRRNLHVRRVPLSADQVTVIEPYLVTTLERTAADLARLLGHEEAVAVLDAALHAKANRETIAHVIAQSVGRHGVGRARAALAFADARAESVGESLSRTRLVAAGIPLPVLQLNIFDSNGFFLGRSDFAWPQLGVLGEFDGRVKYRGGADEVSGVVMAEKSRQENLVAMGWELFRWNLSDTRRPEVLRSRFQAACSRADPARIGGHWVPSS